MREEGAEERMGEEGDRRSVFLFSRARTRKCGLFLRWSARAAFWWAFWETGWMTQLPRERERERVARQVWLLVCLRGGTCWVIGLMSCWEIEGIGVGKRFFLCSSSI